MNSQELKAYFQRHPMSSNDSKVQALVGKLDVFSRPDSDRLRDLLQGSASDFFYQDHQAWLNQLASTPAEQNNSLPSYESLMAHVGASDVEEFRLFLGERGIHFLSRDVYELGMGTTGDPALLQETKANSEKWAAEILNLRKAKPFPQEILEPNQEEEEEDTLAQEAAKVIFDKIIEQVGGTRIQATGLAQIGAMWKFGLDPECTIAEALKAILE